MWTPPCRSPWARRGAGWCGAAVLATLLLAGAATTAEGAVADSIAPGNLVQNGNFTNGTTDWGPWQSDLGTASIQGTPVATVTWNGSGSSGFSINQDSVVNAVPAGTPFSAQARVITPSGAGIGHQIALFIRMRESNGTIDFSQESSPVMSSTSWQTLSMNYTIPAGYGGDNIDVYVIEFDTTAGDAFDVTDVSLVDTAAQPPPTPTATPTPTPTPVTRPTPAPARTTLSPTSAPTGAPARPATTAPPASAAPPPATPSPPPPPATPPTASSPHPAAAVAVLLPTDDAAAPPGSPVTLAPPATTGDGGGPLGILLPAAQPITAGIIVLLLSLGVAAVVFVRRKALARTITPT